MSDRAMRRLLDERKNAGVDIRIIGHVAGSRFQPHSRIENRWLGRARSGCNGRSMETAFVSGRSPVQESSAIPRKSAGSRSVAGNQRMVDRISFKE